jgi:hypothetical protein
MREITKLMIDMYAIKKLGYDFMGYTFNKTNELSFHHLVVPKRDCRKQGLGKGFYIWNGAILKQETSHDYLHLIERIDRKYFLQITNYMIEENKNGQLDLDTLKRIREILLTFEEEYKNETDREGRALIKKPYKTDRIIL